MKRLIRASYSDDYFDYDDFKMRISDKLIGARSHQNPGGRQSKIPTGDADAEIRKYCDIHKGCDYAAARDDIYEEAYRKLSNQHDLLVDVVRQQDLNRRQSR